ncbi:uncharacterized protein Gasu_60100 [Galdieria sulphuraria]|uniref:Uncharacterized protein n=1 Tax=Galdieria sulphuraria TaxID=130081 RepID=M2XSF7_GALSU|nr:uncharacterized protein Gasu_60100 [Galdieria sulphuraria]EME26334.1 hypothetical protein Gasu_60100 [Galdieria sulphuraria]|eukprot:XP_005702854.1 hypothetical protein Gasu_60100 [Galdieria sulphuraria]
MAAFDCLGWRIWLTLSILFCSTFYVSAVHRQAATSAVTTAPSSSCALEVEQSWSCFHDIQKDVKDVIQEISGGQPIQFGPNLQSCMSLLTSALSCFSDITSNPITCVNLLGSTIQCLFNDTIEAFPEQCPSSIVHSYDCYISKACQFTDPCSVDVCHLTQCVTNITTPIIDGISNVESCLGDLGALIACAGQNFDDLKVCSAEYETFVTCLDPSFTGTLPSPSNCYSLLKKVLAFNDTTFAQCGFQ